MEIEPQVVPKVVPANFPILNPEARVGAVLPELSPSSEAILPFELDLLREAVRYQGWVFKTVAPFLGNRILEVGSGIGNMSRWLPVREKLILTEAETGLLPILESTIRREFKGDDRVQVRSVDLSQDWKAALQEEDIDTIISFNVLEHIEDDAKAFDDLVSILKASKTPGPSGKKRLITFVPAHQWAYGSMDKEFGHFRRYSIQRFKHLKEMAAPDADLYWRYFNVIGLPSWVFLGRVLRRKQIGHKAVMAFERICPWVQGFDDFLHERLRLPLGQSILCVLTL